MEKNGNRETEASAPQKCVQVTDEAGNRYEATYPKRARGLVKHGRARFTDESQTEIMLTCPPNQNLILEDHTMTEQNTNIRATENETVVANENTATEKNAPQLTAKEIFDQITVLQRQMVESSYNALYRLTDATNGICGDGCFESDDAKGEAIESVASTFRLREETYQTMLKLYQQMYNDLRGDQKAEQTCAKIEAISDAFANHGSFITDAELNSEDKASALSNITEKVADLIKSVL